MSDLYQECHRRVQEAQGTQPLATRLDEMIVHDTLTEDDIAFIRSLDYFFLSTVDPTGQPTVSYKAGPKGFVREKQGLLTFPFYDGNGMFLSAGNIDGSGKVGMLFIDLETPRRLRINGTARLRPSTEEDGYPGAKLLAEVEPNAIFVNCPRYIHKFQRVETAKHVPDENGEAPLARWKRLDAVNDVISKSDKAKVEEAGMLGLEELQEDFEAGRA
ncbi:predicted pyridoxamine 5'-phosphate oxidase [Fulvimarina pelagi HTCC2506]|uniref:Predicted pyridoxamine 5'-phosphate oxidase n=1 Tax=Fulvimarina pelagi HTCC2506 TaxID=314231 RepID=Q0G7W6_9HYPH|nr:pyridoxamine 5'-phosphate oxidase family protein [Fulvimarina pelagi]EAU42248.1 predicted pyridoxamine 5'-phosphate oxidase [Fulvimarina pelagi HTCC2506]